MADKNYKIAQITQAEEKAIQKAEADVKAETGKDYVMIAWEKEQLILLNKGLKKIINNYFCFSPLICLDEFIFNLVNFL